MVFVPRIFRKGDLTAVPNTPSEEAELIFDGWTLDGGSVPDTSSERHVEVGELSSLAVAAVEDAPAVTPTGAWDFAQAPTVAGVSLRATVDSVNGETGLVVLDADDITDTATRVFMTPAERTKLGGVATAATANATDAQLRDRSTHTGTQVSATLSDLVEVVQDIVGAFVVAGTGVTVAYDDAAGTFTINATASGGTTDPEVVRDVIGTAMVAGTGIQITVNDAGDQITIASTAVLPTRQVISGTGLTGGGDLSANRTLAVAYGTAAGTAVQGNDTRVAADQAAATASIRTLGTGATQAAAGNHTHTATGISDSTATGRSLLTAADAPAARTAIGAGTASTKADVGLGSVDNTSDASKPVSTAQQTALDAKANRLVTINAQAGPYTLALTDANDVAVHMTSGSAVALTYPPNSAVAIPIGASGMWFAAGAGQITHTPGAGVTVQSVGGGLKSGGQFSEGTWRKVAINTFVVSGLLTT